MVDRRGGGAGAGCRPPPYFETIDDSSTILDSAPDHRQSWTRFSRDPREKVLARYIGTIFFIFFRLRTGAAHSGQHESS